VGPGNTPVYNGDYDDFIIINTSGASLIGQSLASAPFTTLCFLPETLIRLVDNHQKQAGNLVIGDLVATPEGPQAVKFIGKTTRNIFDLRETGRMPIRIEAGALGELGPDATLHCTPSHAFHINAAFIAKALGDIAKAKGMTQVAKDSGLTRESLYKSLSGERSPCFDTILKVIAALGLSLHAAPAIKK